MMESDAASRRRDTTRGGLEYDASMPMSKAVCVRIGVLGGTSVGSLSSHPIADACAEKP